MSTTELELFEGIQGDHIVLAGADNPAEAILKGDRLSVIQQDTATADQLVVAGVDRRAVVRRFCDLPEGATVFAVVVGVVRAVP